MSILEPPCPRQRRLQGQPRRHAGADRADARAGGAHARGLGRAPRTGFTSAASCCRASAWRWCSIPARPSSNCRRWPATCSTCPMPTRACPAAASIAGIGFVSGVRCMVSANDSGIDAGALQPYGLDKTLRVQELALENKLPYVQLVESAGANLLRYRVEDFVRGGNIFRNLARLSAAGLPVVTVTHGSSTAGGAYQTGLSDYIVMVRGRTRAFLAGPPLLKAATGEIATEEELGGAEMHTSDLRSRRLSRRGRPRRAADRARHHGQSGMGPAERRTDARIRAAALRPRGTARHHGRWTTSGRSTCAR